MCCTRLHSFPRESEGEKERVREQYFYNTIILFS